jgi:type I restriction enzyme S subunit
MKAPAWPVEALGTVLTAREERPAAEDLLTGRVPIIAKISFGTGCISLRTGGETRTGMILVRPGDLIVSGINVTKGAIAIHDSGSQPVAATIHYGAYHVDRGRADVRFLWWLLRSRYFQRLLLDHLPGGIKTELKAKRLLQVPVPLPSLDEQKRVVTRLASLSEEIQRARAIQSTSRDLGKIAVETAIEKCMRGLEVAGILADVLSLKPRSGPSFVTNSDWTGTPVLMPSAVSGFGVDTRRLEFGTGVERVSELDRLKPGDILIARGNKREQVGNAGVVPEAASGFVCANLLMRMRVAPDLADPYFVVYWLRAPFMRNYVRTRMTGTSPNIQKINQATVLKLPFPSRLGILEQQRIVKYLNSTQVEVDHLKRAQSEVAIELGALLPAVLDLAFRGEML